MSSFRQLTMQLGILCLPFAAVAAAAQQAGPGAAGSEVEEPASRYAVEIIVFTYAESVSAGTEVFLPQEPELPGDAAPADPGIATGGDDIGTLPPGTRELEDLMQPGPVPDDSVDQGPSFGDTLPPADEEPTVDLSQPLERIVTDAASIEYTRIPPDLLTMTAAHEQLLLLDAYQPVLWSGWTQIVREEEESPAINLRRLGSLPLSMSGDVTLYLGRFVHLVVDVALEEETARAVRNQDVPEYGDFGRYSDRYGPSYGPPEPAKIVYRIQEDRIMRNGEVRYFDHPKFGLIAKLTLVEEAEVPETDPRYLPDLLPGAPGDPGR